MIGIINGHKHAGQGISTPANTTLTNAGQYYQIVGVFTPMDLSFFTHNVDGTLTYKGPSSHFLFTGASDVGADKACELTYGLFKNGILVSGAETPVSITVPDKTANISITGISVLIKDDAFDVRAKSDQASTVLTVKTLSTTFWGK